VQGEFSCVQGFLIPTESCRYINSPPLPSTPFFDVVEEEKVTSADYC
jgi:hypothetical protein